MTLSLRHKVGTFRRTDNAIPIWPGHFATRPGATQLVTGEISAAVEWDGRLLFYRGQDCLLWDHIEHSLGASGNSLDATAFQALIGNAEREDRLYVADGVNPLWYVVYDPVEGYQRKTITNELLDGDGSPYPIPVASAVATFRKRLWVIHGGNRAQHSDNDKPHHFDPLFTVELQSGRRSRLTALVAQNDYLAVGTLRAIWSIVGDSQFNWADDALVQGRGATGPTAMDGDGTRLFFVSDVGAHELGAQDTMGENNLDPAFQAGGDSSAQAKLSPDGRFLLLVVRSRLFVINTRSQEIGEVVENVRGVFTLGNHWGWFGDNGIWVCNRVDGRDTFRDGSTRKIPTLFATWQDFSETRALLTRTLIEAIGEADSPITYTATVDHVARALTVPGAPAAVVAIPLWDGSIVNNNSAPSHHEIPVDRAGHHFEHQVSCDGRMELVAFKPVFRGRQQ